MSYMTKIEGVPDTDSIREGMAYFSGTGPQQATCGACKHRGYTRESQRGHWKEHLQQIVHKAYRTTSCAMFRKLAGCHGPAVKKDYPACKYFEPSPK